jgi:hypothetical protein
MTLFTQGALEVNFTGAAWEDVTPYMTGPLQIVQGRPNEWSQITPGVMTVTLKNTDARFMPGLSTSPYYPNMVPEKQIRWWVRMSGNWYVRFWGYIKAIEPAFPGNSTNQAIVKISAVDNLGLVAGKKLYCSWLHSIRFNSVGLGVRWDGFVVKNADGNAAAYLDNVTDSAGTKSRATITPAAGGLGEMTFGDAAGLSIEGSIKFNPAENRTGSIVRIDSSNAMRGLNFFVRFPGRVQTSAGSAQRDVVTFIDGGGAVQARLRLDFSGASKDNLIWMTPANVFVSLIAANVDENRWVMINVETLTATPTTTRCGFDANFADYAGFDFRNTRAILFGGNGSTVPEMEIAGIATSASENGISYIKNQGLTAGLGGAMSSRISGLTSIIPVALVTVAGGDYTAQTLTGNWHDRTALDMMQEQMRTIRGFWWARSFDSVLTAVPLATTYPGTPLITIDAEGHMLGTLELREAVESVPTRVTVEYPAGQVTVIDAARETAAGTQIRNVTSTTIIDSQANAETLATTLLGNASTKLRIASFTLDLETATSDTVAAMFATVGDLPGLYPTQRIRITLPASHFNPSTVDAFVEGWTEVYDGASSCRITFDLSA